MFVCHYSNKVEEIKTNGATNGHASNTYIIIKKMRFHYDGTSYAVRLIINR